MLSVDKPRTAGYRVLLIAAGVFSLLLAPAVDASALYGLGAGLLYYVAMGWALSRRSGRGIEVSRSMYPSAFEKDHVAVDITVKNLGSRSTHLIEVSDNFGPSLAGRVLLLESGPLEPMHQRTLSYAATCGRRWGVHDCGPIVVTGSDPMGLFHREWDLEGFCPFDVFPNVHEVGALSQQGSIASLTAQSFSAARPGQGSEFLGVREYRPGDDFRRVHWPATAQHGKPMVRELEVDLIPYCTLLVDLDKSFRAGMGLLSVSEFVVRTAASIIWTACHQGAIVQAFGEEKSGSLYVEPGRGEDHLINALDQLIHLQLDGETPILDLLEDYQNHMPSGSLAVILSSTVQLESERLESMLLGLEARDIVPVVICVNNYSFSQLDGFAPPQEEVEETILTLEGVIHRERASGLILNRLTTEKAMQEELAVQLERGLR